MSEKILQALMQLFAIVANAERLTVEDRGIVVSFLTQQLSQSNVARYLKIFDDYLMLLQGKADPSKVKKRVSVNSVKVLRICADINLELDQKQKYIVLIRLIEFAYSSNASISEQESEFLDIVANSFNISPDEYADCLSIGSGLLDIQTHASKFLLISSDPESARSYDKFIYHESLPGRLYVLYIKQAGILFTRYFGEASLTLNGIPIVKNTCYIINQGGVIRGNKILALYYSDIMKLFIGNASHFNITFNAKQISYQFRNGKTGLHPVDFSVSSGNLIGIMGGSGAGKSTLLNVLNTNLKPYTGEVLINGKNIHDKSVETEGIIGYVPQDDLLIEELTVMQNLFFSSKLCFGNLPDEEIKQKANAVLESLGLQEIKHLKVGSSIDKTISGGQRKRLNIALELIREPAILFIDEPTSGLSSRDSENVMDMLKQLTIGGTLLFVVIHQPSSDIFKMFDKLLILDIGGYPVYFGNPSDSIIYFKQRANYADAEESDCYTCGYLNPEQVFSIIESKVLDEFGNTTLFRKISPEEWNRLYLENKIADDKEALQIEPLKKPKTKKPAALKQFFLFIQRDVLSKLANRQYMLINMLEAPVLALLLSYLLRYFEGDQYIFRENMNLPAYIFMGVIVSLFMGLTVSAEEIIRDRKIRKRESFLNLSHLSYLFSKISILFFISAIQTLLFVVIGNNIIGIRGMFMEYWLVLFSVSCFANVLGLNISASFNEVVTIYILIPLLIIPQILTSGIIVKFENMNPTVAAYDKVPWIGEFMTARWAFEALAVNQYKNNNYEKQFFNEDKDISYYHYKSSIWTAKLNAKLDEIKADQGNDSLTVSKNLRLIKNEIESENKINPSLTYPIENIPAALSTTEDYMRLKDYFKSLSKFYNTAYSEAIEKKDNYFTRLIADPAMSAKHATLKTNFTNKSIDDLLLNSLGTIDVREYNGRLVRGYQPVYTHGEINSTIRAPFFVNSKAIFGNLYDTFWINIGVIWIFTLLLFFALYFTLLRKVIAMLTVNR